MRRIRSSDLRDALPPDVKLPRRLGWEDIVEVLMFGVTLLIAWVLLWLLFPEGVR